MGHAVDFPGTNTTLQAPKGSDEVSVSEMSVYSNGVTCTSCWELSPEELQEVIRTGKLYVTVVSGKSQPPIYLGGEHQTRELIADWGVWKKEAVNG